MKNILVYLLLSSFLIPLKSYAQSDLDAFFEKKYEKRMKKNDVIGMSIGLIDKGEIIHKQSFGYENLENEIKASSKTQYKIGSISKVFTGIALLKLQEEGKVDLNHSITKYIPEIAIQSRFLEENTLLIKDLLSHSSGMPSDMVNGMFCSSPEDFEWTINKINQQYMARPPKFEFSYSNLGYGLLGELIARISGETYVNYMKKEVFDELGLNDTYVFNGEETLSKAYVKEELYNPDRIRDQAAGSVVSTVDDMLEFILFFMNEGKVKDKEFLSRESMKLLEEDYLEGNVVENSYGYSLGLFLHPCKIIEGSLSELDTLIEHGGDTYAFHASFGFLKHKKIGGVLLTNSKNGGRINSIHSMIRAYLDDTYFLELEKNYKSIEAIEQSQKNPLTEEEILGKYTVSNFILDVDNKKRIKSKIMGNKIIMKENDEVNSYNLILKLFGFIPIRMRSIQFVLFENQGEIYVSQENKPNQMHDMVGIKLDSISLNESWQSYIGNYEPIDLIESNFEKLQLKGDIKLSIEDDLLKLEFPEKFMISSVYLIGDAENMAYTTGLGRNSGYSLTVLENGNLAFMGYELQKKKE